MQCRQLWLWTGTGTHLLTTAYFYIVRDRKYQFIERHLVLVENHVISSLLLFLSRGLVSGYSDYAALFSGESW